MSRKQEIVNICENENISLVRLLWVDNGGIVRGRVIDADDLESAIERGVSWPQGVQRLTALDESAQEVPVKSSGEVMLLPDTDTFRVLPYADRTVAMLCDAYSLDREPWSLDPRSRLSAYLEELESTGLRIEAAFESEFYLLKETEEGIEPYDDYPDHSADGMQNVHDIILDIVECVKDQEMDFSIYYPELGPGQQEVVINHTSGLAAADNKVFHEQTVKAIADSHGAKASFIPTPFKNEAGSGCHIHISLWDENNDNCFFNDESDSMYPLSETAREFIAGILTHAPALLAITTPNVISYRRIRSNSFASAHTCWGEGNREAMVRVPATVWDNKEDSVRIEYKPADNTTNPYLALLAIIAAGMDGIERSLDPGPPTNKSPTDLSADERDDRNIKRLPTNLGDALAAFEENEVIAEAFGEELHNAYLKLKRHQWETFSGKGEITNWELENFIKSF